MPVAEERNLIARSGDGTQSELSLKLDIFSPKEMKLRAFKFAAALIGLAILSLPLPGLHFVLVPGFGIASVVAFLIVCKMKEKLKSIEGPCPSCGQEIKQNPNGNAFPQQLTCDHCRKNFEVDNNSQAAA